MNASDTAEQVHESAWFDHAVRAGLIAYGVVHLLVAWLAVQLALGDKEDQASNSGALHYLAQQPMGKVLVWLIAVGMFMVSLPRSSALKFPLYDLHNAFGIVVMIIALVRIYWRAGWGDGSIAPRGYRERWGHLVCDDHTGGRIAKRRFRATSRPPPSPSRIGFHQRGARSGWAAIFRSHS